MPDACAIQMLLKSHIRNREDIMAEENPHQKVISQDPFIGVFDIEFVGPRRMRAEGVRIVHWRRGDGVPLYLIDEHGSVYVFANINMMHRIGD
jgi:hypothetical protein